MFEKTLTPAEYKAISDQRSNLARQLLVRAFQDYVPPGYVLSADPDRMHGNALLALRPAHSAEGTKMVTFIHAINYRPSVSDSDSDSDSDSEVAYRPTVESLRACGDVKGSPYWGTDQRFGADGRVEITSMAGVDLAAMVGFIAAQVCSFEPFTAFGWRRCAHDEGGKWELFNGERRMQSVWKSGDRYGTLMGTCPLTLVAAKAEAEAAARFMICCEHQERLASLSDHLVEVATLDEHEGTSAPSM